MTRIRTLTALAATALALAAAPAALANTATTGNTSGSPTMNLCLVNFDCTYINYTNNKPSDVIGHNGTITSWSINVGIYGGPEKVKLRVLRPQSGGKFKDIGDSSWATIYGNNVNTFKTKIKVHAGDVLALENSSSAILMATEPTGKGIHYFDGIAPNGILGHGATGKPDRTTPELHTLLSAKLSY
jgi:hypothetical protein